jgi:hypothetical protein
VTPVPPIKRSALGDLTLFGSGGQGKVFRFAVRPPELSGVGFPLLYKEYDDKSRQELDADVLHRMVERGGRFDLRWLLQQGLAWPLAVVVDGPTTVGFVMQEAPPEFTVELQLPTGPSPRIAQLQYALNDHDYLRRISIPVSDQWRLRVLSTVAQTLRDLHEHDIVVGDLSPNNLLASFGFLPHCFFLDCDGMQIEGRSALPPVETPEWAVPAGEQLSTEHSDAYKFALLATRLFAGSQQSRDTAAIAAFDPALGRLAQLGLAAEPVIRPRPADWIAALDNAATSASTTTPADPVRTPPLRPTGTAAPVPTPSAPPGPARRPRLLAGTMVAAAVLVALVLAMLGVGLLQSVIATPEAAVETAPVETAPVELAAGTALVAIDPAAAAHPRAAEVVGLLDRHFTAINTRDYDTWATTVVPSRSGIYSRAEWQQAYRSTTMESVMVTSISEGSFGELAVKLTFVSTQAVVDAPAKMPMPRICWTATWPVSTLADRDVIGVPAAYTTSFRGC